MSEFEQCRRIINGEQSATQSKAPVLTLTPAPLRKPQPVICPHCGFTIFDGDAIRSRCVKPVEAVAKCRCKRFISVPIVFSQNSQNSP